MKNNAASEIVVIIATHKKYFMPTDPVYLPLHVGKANKESIGYQGDDTGEHISEKNPYFCELTGLYWAWKNLRVDYLGMIHYRRFFTKKSFLQRRKEPLENLYLTYPDISSLLSEYDIVVPKRRKYYIETLYSHYAHTFYKEHLDITREIISEFFPEYINSFDVVMKQRSGYMFNMFIMPRKLLDHYCNWLFFILFELERRVPEYDYSDFHARFYGRVSELLFNVWLYNISNKRALKIKEVPFVYSEKINWLNKCSAFLMAKFFGKKYNKSF